MPADLADPSQARLLFDAAVDALGSVSIFVHCASPRRRESETALAVTGAEWDAMLTVGLRSGFMLGQAAGRHMKELNIKGRMLFITSLHAYAPRNLPHYSATKAGQTMVVKELARALGPYGIRVNAIAPGAIPGGGFDADTTALEKMIPMGRTGTPEDVAGMAIALLCDRFSRYVTGTTVAVDGGIALYNCLIPASAWIGIGRLSNELVAKPLAVRLDQPGGRMGKWIGSTNRPVPAVSPRNRRRERAASF